jgi:hypothetical protein
MATYEYRIVQVMINSRGGRVFSSGEMDQLAKGGWRVVAGGGAGGMADGHQFENNWVVMEREVESEDHHS